MAPTLTILCLLQLVALFYKGCAAEDKAADLETADLGAADLENDDLETQETSWMITDPIQKKLQEIQYVKGKLLSPFMKTGYPGVYLTSGNGGTHYPAPVTSFFPANSWKKPVKTAVPSFSQVWYNKGVSGTSTYAPNCDHGTSSWRPSSWVPSTSTSSGGTPLNYYYTSTGPTRTYGTPYVNFATKSSSLTGASSLPAQQQSTESDSVVVKAASGQQPLGSFQTIDPSSYWSSSPWQLPSQSSSGSSVPSWSGVSGFYPTSSGSPQPPAAISSSPLWSGAAGYYPVPSQVSSSGQSVPSWSTITSSAQSSQLPAQVSSASYPPFWSYFPQGSQYSPPSPSPQQYYVASSTPAPSTESDQGEVRITPAPAQLKSNFVSTLPGTSVALPVDASVYSPGSAYVGSYYPNVFYITNEQHLEKPNNSDVTDQGRSILQATSKANSPPSDTTLASNDSTTVSVNNESTLGLVKSSIPPTVYTSNIVNQPRFPLVVSVPQPFLSSAGFYSSSGVPSPYSQWGTVSQLPSSPVVPATRTSSSLTAYPIPLGYRYQPPSVAFQTGFQSFLSKTGSPPC